MFKIDLESGGSNIVYKPLSVALKYLVDNKKLEESFLHLETIFNLKFSQLQKKNFLSEDNAQIRAVNPEGKPDELIISKVKLNDSFTSDYFRSHLASLLQALKTKSLELCISSFLIMKYSKIISRHLNTTTSHLQRAFYTAPMSSTPIRAVQKRIRN
jgi:hypothetical protein